MSENDKGEAARAIFSQGNADRMADNAAAAREEAERKAKAERLETERKGTLTAVFSRCFYYKPKLYYFKEKNQFIPQDKESIRKRLQDAVGDSNIADILLEVESKNYIPTVYQMQPGRRAGVMESKGLKYIVLNDYYFPYETGQQGKCDTILNVLSSLFGDEQTPYFLAWVKGARYRIKQCLQTGDYTTACQIMCVIGAHDLGKTNILCKLILEPLFGGNMIDVGEMLKQGKQFNGELLGGCFLVSDDKGTMQGNNARRRAADTMKNIGYAGNFSIEAKGKTAISVRAPWVQMILANEDDSGINSIPDFSGMEDKFMALYAERRDSFPPNSTDEERTALNKSIADEMPAFAWYVDHYSPPMEIREESGRHACRSFVNSKIAKMLQPLTEEAKLMNAIEMLISDPVTLDVDAICKPEGISAVTLQGYLKRRNLWKDENNRAIGRKLTSLCQEYPQKIQKRKAHGNISVYIISRPADAGETEE